MWEIYDRRDITEYYLDGTYIQSEGLSPEYVEVKLEGIDLKVEPDDLVSWVAGLWAVKPGFSVKFGLVRFTGHTSIPDRFVFLMVDTDEYACGMGRAATDAVDNGFSQELATAITANVVELQELEQKLDDEHIDRVTKELLFRAYVARLNVEEDT